MITPTEKIWRNGELINWNDATVHVLTHALHYGSSVFEGIRCYETATGPALFRIKEHVRRMFDSAKIYRMDVPRFTKAEIADACREIVRANGLKSCYIRPRGLSWLRRDGRSAAEEPNRDLYLLLGMGQVPRRRGDRARRGRLRFVLDAHRSQYPARHGQGRRELHEFATD